MKINVNLEIYVPSGFYCERNGGNKCSRLNVERANRPYCELFYPFLDTNKYGDVLKCDKCLLAEREQRISE